MRNLLISIIFLCFTLQASLARAEDVCISENDTLDLITLLDAYDHDLTILSNCEELNKELNKQLLERNSQVESLTVQLVKAKQQELKYMASARTWRTVAWVSTATGILIVVISVAAKL